MNHYIEQWRKYRGFTRESLAERMGCSHAQIYRVEHGKQSVTLSFLDQAAEALHCRPLDLLSGEPEEGEGLRQIWDRLTSEERHQGLLMLEALAKAGASGAPAIPEDSDWADAPDLGSVGGRLRWVRKRAGFATTTAASRAAGYPANHVGALEAGHMLISQKKLLVLAKLYHVSPAWLLLGEGPPHER